MINYLKILTLAGSSFLLLNLTACGTSDRSTGNDESAAHSEVMGNDTAQNRMNKPDTTVTGVPGNTNAVNSAGDAGDGSGMGSSSLTKAAKQTPANNK